MLNEEQLSTSFLTISLHRTRLLFGNRQQWNHKLTSRNLYSHETHSRSLSTQPITWTHPHPKQIIVRNILTIGWVGRQTARNTYIPAQSVRSTLGQVLCTRQMKRTNNFVICCLRLLQQSQALPWGPENNHKRSSHEISRAHICVIGAEPENTSCCTWADPASLVSFLWYLKPANDGFKSTRILWHICKHDTKTNMDISVPSCSHLRWICLSYCIALLSAPSTDEANES